MTVDIRNPIDILRDTIAGFAMRYPQCVVWRRSGQRLIEEGTESEEFFLIQRGELSILARNPDNNIEREIAVRFDGDIVGEGAILPSRRRRSASVLIASDSAMLVRLFRHDILGLMRCDKSLNDTIMALSNLDRDRHAQIAQVLGRDGQPWPKQPPGRGSNTGCDVGKADRAEAILGKPLQRDERLRTALAALPDRSGPLLRDR